MKAIILLLVIAAVLLNAFSTPIRNRRPKIIINSPRKAQAHLEKYGYSSKNVKTAARSSLGPSAESIRSYQRFMGIPRTGVLDRRTMEQMNKPRCGMPDIRAKGKRSLRYSIDPNYKWSKMSLTYYITTYSQKLSRSVVASEIRRAFQVWEAVTPLRFTETDKSADIIIFFAEGAHGDGHAFDGDSGTLAHAFFPEDGDAHFDEAEQWTVNVDKGINLFQVAAHEFGHSLGLDHSGVNGALMYPSYEGYQANFQLHKDDIAGVQALYGANSGVTQTTRPQQTTTKPQQTTTTSHHTSKTTSREEDNTTNNPGAETTGPFGGDPTYFNWGNGDTSYFWGTTENPSVHVGTTDFYDWLHNFF